MVYICIVITNIPTYQNKKYNIEYRYLLKMKNIQYIIRLQFLKMYSNRIYNASYLLSDDWSNLKQQYHDLGRSIPKTVMDGIKKGKYDAPMTVEEMDNLVHFDDIVQRYKALTDLQREKKVYDIQLTVDEEAVRTLVGGSAKMLPCGSSLPRQNRPGADRWFPA